MKYLIALLLMVLTATAQPRNGPYAPPGIGGSTNIANLTNAFTVFIGAGGSAVETAGLQALLSVPGNIVIIPYKANGYTFGQMFVTNSVQLWNLGSTLKFDTAATGFMFDTKDNTNWVFDGVIIDGQNTVTNFMTLLPTAVSDWVPFYRDSIVAPPRHGFSLNMKGGKVGGCLVTGMDGKAYQGHNSSSGLAYQTPVTIFYNDKAIKCRFGFDFPSITNVLNSPEYLSLSDIQASSCSIGARATGGNIQIVNSKFEENGIGVVTEGGDNGNHGGITGSTINHNTCGIYGYFNDSGCNIVNCEIKANGNDVYLDTCSGIEILDCPLHSVINYTMTGSGQDNSIRNCVYSGSWATVAKITNSASTGNIIIGGNHSWNSVGNTDGSFTNGTAFFRIPPGQTPITWATNSLIAWIPTNAAPFTITTNDFSLNTFYTNRNQRAYMSECFSLANSTTPGEFTRISLFLDQNGDGTFEQTGMSIQNQDLSISSWRYQLGAYLQPGARFMFTNQSSGTVSATVITGSAQLVNQ